MSFIRSHKAAGLAIVLAGVVIAGSVVSPAFGGPSLTSVAKTARKGLSTARKANSRAKRAQRTANTALRTAAVRDVSRDASVPAGGDVYELDCPAGFAPVGWGAIPVSGANSFVVGASPVSRGYLYAIYAGASGDKVTLDVTCVGSRDARTASARGAGADRFVRERLRRELVRARRR
jgi:hypothetical protein